MDLTLTPDVPAAAVVLTVSAAVGVEVSAFRSDRYGVQTPLRGNPFPLQGGGAVIVDPEAPFGPVEYTVTDDAGSATADTSLDVDVPWITHPYRPWLSEAVTVEDDREWTYPSRTWSFDVIDRDAPVFTHYKRSTRTGTLVLRWRDPAQRSALGDLLQSGDPLLIRYPADCDAFRDTWMALGEARVEAQALGASFGFAELDYVAIAPPTGSLDGDTTWTFADILLTFAEFADLPDTYASFADVVVDDRIEDPTASSGWGF